MRHTNGPWTTEDTPTGDIVVTARGGLLSIAEVHDHSATSTEHEPDEVRANAQLIAAAPDMLMALRNALTWMETMKRNDPTITDAGPLAHSIATARAVIAKAEG